ncbi:MAG: methionine ABC transporter ATP-binding protein [Pauljensenia sp.]
MSPTPDTLGTVVPGPHEEAPGTGVAVRFSHVSKTFTAPSHDVQALSDMTLDVPVSSIQGIIGYSGAGKSTLVRMVNGLERPTSGRVWVEAQEVETLHGSGLRDLKKHTAMVFQSFNLLETRTVAANVAMPLVLDGVDSGERDARVEEALDFVGLTDRSAAHPGELSGGQKQRVGIARALVRRPPILLCDEATSALDPATTTQIVELLDRINREFSTTIIVVTHEMDVIKDLCDSVAVMESGEIVESGPVLEIFNQPRHSATRRFVEGVVPSTPPASLIEAGGGGQVWRLVYAGEGAGRPLLSQLVRDFDLEVNILAATVTEIRHHTVGHMVVRVSGSPEDLLRGAEELRGNGVQVATERTGS